MDDAPGRQSASIDDLMLGLCLKAIDQGWTVTHRKSGTWSFAKGPVTHTGLADTPGQLVAVNEALSAYGFEVERKSRHGDRMGDLIAEALDQGWSVRRTGRGAGEYSFRQYDRPPVTGSASDITAYMALTKRLMAGGLYLGTGTITPRLRSTPRAPARRSASRTRKTGEANRRSLS